MTAFLIDEMFGSRVAELLRDTHGYDAVHVDEIGLRAHSDAEVAAVARAEGRAVVTENVADFAAEPDLIVVFVRQLRLPPAGAQAAGLAKLLDRWAAATPQPYVGPHWPAT